MGAWGIGNFDNDEALNWVHDLAASRNFSVVDAALEAALSEYPEEPEACRALAAAEVVAALAGRPPSKLPEPVEAWLRGKPAPPAALVAKAQRALAGILASSELKDLWGDDGDGQAWRALVMELQARLR